MELLEKAQEYKILATAIQTIVSDENMSWEDKYDLIFSKEISYRITQNIFFTSYADPDTTEEADVYALYCAVLKSLDIVNKILEANI